MFEILAKFFRFSGRENGNKFKLSMVIGLVEALASAMKIPAIMYILIGLLGGKPIGKYIGGSLAIMVIAIVIAVICKRSSTVLQTEGGYNASAFTRIKIAEHLRYLPMGFGDNQYDGITRRYSSQSGYADNAGDFRDFDDHPYAACF